MTDVPPTINDSSYLCEADARALLRLLGDVAELDGDHRVKKRFLISELAQLLQADVWLWVQGQKHDQSDRAIPFLHIDGGWTNDEQKACYVQWHSHPEYATLVLKGIADLWGQFFTVTRQQIVPDQRWYDSSLYRDWYLPAGLDQFLATVYPIGRIQPDELTVSGLMFHRATGAPAFDNRDRFLLHLVAAEVEWLHRAGTEVAAAQRVADITAPRLWAVLLLLFSGDSKKQIADKLGLSYHTIDDYMKQIYRRFDVQSRGELMAQFLAGQSSVRMDPS